MIGRITPRHAGHRFAGECVEPRSERFRARYVADPRPRVRDVLAELHELGRFGAPHTAADPYPARRDFEVEPCALFVLKAARAEDRCSMRLERSFVAAETRIAIHAEERQIGRAHV